MRSAASAPEECATPSTARTLREKRESSSAIPRPVAAAGSGRISSALSNRVVAASPPAPKQARRQLHDHDTTAELARVSLERRIRAHMPRGALAVTFTDNRYTMISVRRERKHGPVYKVRLHHMFADADPAIARALARYIYKNDRDSSRLLGDYIDRHQHRVRPEGRHTTARPLTTRGTYYDLQQLFDELNERYFGNSIDARITWGQRSGRPRRRNSIKMGSYSVEDRLIRIHRSLDRAFVPRYFIEWIVFHEMLHQIHDIKVVNGRRQFHPKAFLEDEAKYEHYERARLWERANLDALLTY